MSGTSTRAITESGAADTPERSRLTFDLDVDIAVVETAVLILAGGSVIFGLGMTQQQQTAHGRNLDSFWPELIYKHMPGTR